MRSRQTHGPKWTLKLLTFIINIHEMILDNVSANYTVLRHIFHLSDNFYEKRPLLWNFVVKLLRFSCALKKMRTNQLPGSNSNI